MPDWIVRGTAKINFEMRVQADSEDEAYEVAESTWDGPEAPNVDIIGEDEPEFYDAYSDGNTIDAIEAPDE